MSVLILEKSFVAEREMVIYKGKAWNTLQVYLYRVLAL